MKQREKAVLIAGALIVCGVVGFKAIRRGSTSNSGSSIVTSISRINEGDRLRASVEGLIDELGISVPKISTAEQENQIRQDLARKTQENKLVAVSLTRIESSGRGRSSSTSVQSIEYLLDLYGRYDDFMKLFTDLERSAYPYVVRNIKFDSNPRTPGEQGQGGPDQNSDQVKLPSGETVSLSSLSGPARERAEAYMRSRSRGGPEGSKKDQPNGRVHATVRVQSYLFPPELGVTRTQTAAAPRTAPTPGMGQSANAAQTAPAAKPAGGAK